MSYLFVSLRQSLVGTSSLPALIPDKATVDFQSSWARALRQGWLISVCYRRREMGAFISSTRWGSDQCSHICSSLCWLWSWTYTPSPASSEPAVQQPRWDMWAGPITWRDSLWVWSVARPPSSTSSLTLDHEATLIAPSRLMDAQLTHSFGRQWTRWSMQAHTAYSNTSQHPATQPPRDSKAHSDCYTLAAWLRALTPAVTTAQLLHRNREMTL